MITALDYARMAEKVYGLDTDDTYVPGYMADESLAEYGMSWGFTGTDYKGCVYVSQSLPEYVVTFQGTVLGPNSKKGDIVADIQILLGNVKGSLPHYCGDAIRLFQKAQVAYASYTPRFTGHSLGGALAQVLGQWMGIPFVTFNAPGMWLNIQQSKIDDWKPYQLESIKGTFKGSLLAKQMASTGRNFRHLLDVVSTFGSHYGPVTRMTGPAEPGETGILKYHSMKGLRAIIQKSDWGDKDPVNPANKEWGEL